MFATAAPALRLILLASILCIMALAQVPQPAPQPTIEQIQSLIDRGDYRPALDAANRLIARSPRLSEAYRLRANARRNLNDLAGALDDANKAVALDPSNARALGGRAIVKRLLKDHPGALADVDRALAVQPGYHQGYDSRALLRQEAGDLAGALSDANRAIELSPQTPAYLIRRAIVRRNLKDLAGADQDLAKAIALAPTDPSGYFQRGLLRLEQKRWNESIADNTRAIDLKLPDPAGAYNNRGLAYKNSGMLAEARRDFEAALKIQPGDKSAASNLARLDRGDSTGAPQNLPKVLELDPKTESARQRTAEMGGTAKPASAAKTGKPGAIPGLGVRFPDLPKPAGDLWSRPSSGQVSLSPEGPALQLPVSDPAKSTAALSLGELSTTIAGLRALAGPLSPEQEKAWARKWQPFFDFPDPAALKYFQTLNPMLQELQGIRGVVNQAAQDFDGAWAEAVVSHAAGDTAGVQAALAEATHHGQVLKSANARLDNIQKKAQTLGNPPDPKAAKAKAKAWSKKWTMAPGPSAPHIAYLWRIAQREATRLMDAQMYSAQLAYGRKDAVLPPIVYPADEATWVRWFEAGGSGAEPLGAKRPAGELMNEADILRRDWFVTPYPYAFEPGEPNLIDRVTAREAAQTIAAGKKVVTYGRFPNAAALAAKYPPGDRKPAAPPPAAPAPSTASAASAEQKAQMEAEKKANAESIAEKESLVKLIQYNLARDEAEWNRETNSTRKDELYLRVLNNRSAIQNERDLIQTLRTGEYVHTRTPSDDYCHDLMIVRGMEQMEQVGDARRLAAAVDKMALNAAPDQVAKLQEFIARQITQTELAQGNVAKVREVAKAIFNTTQGRREQDAAKNLEDAIRYEDYEARAEKVKSRAALALMITGIAAPAYAAGAGTLISVGGTSTAAVTAVGVVFGATTGTIDGGPLEGLKQGIAMTGLPGMVASEMMTGYQRGGLVSSGGVVGALERGTEAFLAGKLVESVAGKIGGAYAEKAKTGVAPPAPALKPGLTVAQTVESQSFQVAKRRAQQEIKAYRSVLEEVATAKASGANAARLAELEARRVKQALELNENFLAKRIIKADGKAARAGKGAAADAALEQNFAQAVGTVYETKVDPLFKQGVKNAGFQWRRKTPGGKWEPAGELEFKEFRQGAAGKTANTDRDLGLMEKKNQKGEIYELFQGDKSVNVADAEKELQRIYDIAYRRAGGSDPRLAMQHITTSGGLESYKDLVVTQLNDPKNVARIQKGWAAQSAEVLQNKVTHAGTGTGEFAGLFKKIDGANQAAKDIEQRLLPVLKSIQSKSAGQKSFELTQDMDKWRAIHRALTNVENDPVAASRQLKVLTGLDSIGEVSDLAGKAFVGAVKLQ